jgi:uncharacterized protein
MNPQEGLLIAAGPRDLRLLPRMANRHGLITGATGTGKTVSLQVLAESLSSVGVPVFMADVKGDLSGLARAGAATPKIAERIRMLGLADFTFRESPVTCWDIEGRQGHPVRTTMSEMGPLLLSRLFNLNDVQAGVLTIVFRLADEDGLLLLDVKDLREMLRFVSDNAADISSRFGRVSAASIGAIQRALLELETQGGDRLFGEPALNIEDLLQTDPRGRGMINILAADSLMLQPKLYATFLLWLLSELYERLPEVGDLDKPRLVFFFDEAHLLFTDAPAVLLQKIEQVVRLIRSKGVGVFFVTQNPLDVPDIVLGQLGNRIQHALRAFTPRDLKAVKVAAETLRINPRLDVERAIGELAVGEALVSFLDEKGQPEVVERAFIRPPWSQIGPIDADFRQGLIRGSVLYGRYEKEIDRESAYEILRARAERRVAPPAEAASREPRTTMRAPRPEGRRRETMFESMAKSAVRSMGSQIGRSIMRGVLGGILGRRR